MTPQDVVTVLEIVGIVSFSLSGSMIAVMKRVDLFGVLFLGLLTVCGGGIMRDAMLGSFPPRIFGAPLYIALSLFVSLLLFLFARFFSRAYCKNEKAVERINNIFDALGLGAFAVSGTQYVAQGNDATYFLVALCAGLLTATGGGVLRDILLREVPFILKKRIYAVAALAGSGLYLLLSFLSVDIGICTVSSVACVFVLRLLATHYRWNLPKALR